MKAVTAAASGELTWTQIKSLAREYELRSGGDVVATLRWEKQCGSLALGETSDGRWTLKRVGFLSPRVTVRVAGSESDVAIFEPRFLSGGTLHLPGSRRLHWVKSGFWNPEYVFKRDGNDAVLSLKPRFGLLKAEASVTVGESGDEFNELPLLAVLGWYLILLEAEDTAAAALIAAM